jgi:hypothetical protein
MMRIERMTADKKSVLIRSIRVIRVPKLKKNYYEKTLL